MQMNSLTPNQELINGNRKLSCMSHALGTIKAMQQVCSNAVMKASTLHLLQCVFSAKLTSRGVCLEAVLHMHNHQRTAPGFWMKVDLKIHKTVSKSLENEADKLVLHSDESDSDFPYAWAESWQATQRLRQHHVLSAAPAAEWTG